ncbi:MAG TPA: YoaK family protein [Candidatus Sulfotelmatobacter sp.]|nr:YoaK family protein [Candidatus Sulfotelmatobacter sp.]
MVKAQKPASVRGKAAIALLLTFVAGSVDVAGCLILYRVFTAHVSGDTAHLGLDLPRFKWHDAAIAGVVIGSFLLGSVIARTIIEIGARIHLRRVASIALAIEALILLSFIVVAGIEMGMGHTLAPWWLAGLACAMGIQTGTLTRVGPLTVHTTFVTGMLNKLAQLLSHVLFETYHLHFAAGDDRRAFLLRRQTYGKQAVFIFSIWLLYLTGAMCGTLLTLVAGVRALYLPVFLLTTAIIADWMRPLSVEEEKEQSER